MSAAAKACKFGQAEHHRKVERERGLKNYHIKNPTEAYKGIYAGRKGA